MPYKLDATACRFEFRLVKGDYRWQVELWDDDEKAHPIGVMWVSVYTPPEGEEAFPPFVEWIVIPDPSYKRMGIASALVKAGTERWGKMFSSGATEEGEAFMDALVAKGEIEGEKPLPEEPNETE